MSNIVQLPSKAVREWDVVKKALTEALRTGGHDQETIDHVCQVLRVPTLEAFGREILINASGGDDAVHQVNVEFSNVVTSLLLHMVNLAIENIELKRRLEEGGE